MKGLVIRKPCIFVTSGGRTATRFVSKLLALAIKDCHSVQEPDVWRLNSVIKNKRYLWEKIRDWGLYHMTFGKILPGRNLRSLSVARQIGRIGDTAAAKNLHRMRCPYISRLKQRVYAESNLQLTGLLDIIPRVFPNSKTVFMVRDGRSWVRSWMNGDFPIYTRWDPLYYIPSSRPISDMFPDDPFYNHWHQLSLFQKTCWLWKFHIEYALKTIKMNPHAKIIKYEELFEESGQNASMNELLQYLTTFPDGSKVKYQYNGQLSGKRFHQSRLNQFPRWEFWPPELVKQFQEICGDFLLQQGYGSEPQWQEMVASSQNEK